MKDPFWNKVANSIESEAIIADMSPHSEMRRAYRNQLADLLSYDYLEASSDAPKISAFHSHSGEYA